MVNMPAERLWRRWTIHGNETRSYVDEFKREVSILTADIKPSGSIAIRQPEPRGAVRCDRTSDPREIRLRFDERSEEEARLLLVELVKCPYPHAHATAA